MKIEVTKISAIIIVSLVGTFILNGIHESYADSQLDTLLRIASQARDNLSVNISQINSVPIEISQLFKQGSDETDALAKAVNQQNITSARQHFLFAMKLFKQTNDDISSLNMTTSNDLQRADVIQLQSEIVRIDKIGETLRSIAITNHVDINFTQFDQIIQQANNDLNVSNIADASKSIDAANHFLVDAHNSLVEVAKQKTTDRAKDFTVKQFERLNKIEAANSSQNVMPVTPQNDSLTNANSTNSTINGGETPKEMITQLKKLVSEGNVDEALKVIKRLESYQNVNQTINQSVNTVINNPVKNLPIDNQTQKITPSVNGPGNIPVKTESTKNSNFTKTNTNKGESQVIPGNTHSGVNDSHKSNNPDKGSHKNHSKSGNN